MGSGIARDAQHGRARRAPFGRPVARLARERVNAVAVVVPVLVEEVIAVGIVAPDVGEIEERPTVRTAERTDQLAVAARVSLDAGSIEASGHVGELHVRIVVLHDRGVEPRKSSALGPHDDIAVVGSTVELRSCRDSPRRRAGISQIAAGFADLQRSGTRVVAAQLIAEHGETGHDLAAVRCVTEVDTEARLRRLDCSVRDRAEPRMRATEHHVGGRGVAWRVARIRVARQGVGWRVASVDSEATRPVARINGANNENGQGVKCLARKQSNRKSVYFLPRFLSPARPSRPKPRRLNVAGSGTGAGAVSIVNVTPRLRK